MKPLTLQFLDLTLDRNKAFDNVYSYVINHIISIVLVASTINNSILFTIYIGEVIFNGIPPKKILEYRDILQKNMQLQEWINLHSEDILKLLNSSLSKEVALADAVNILRTSTSKFSILL